MDPLRNEQKGKKGNQRFSYHLGVKMSVRMRIIPDEKGANKEIINFINSEGWDLYKIATDKATNTITEVAKDKSLTIDEVREKSA